MDRYLVDKSGWDYTFFLSRRLPEQQGVPNPAPDVEALWKAKNSDGQTDLAKIQAMGDEGWELVSVALVQHADGSTARYLFTFKRPR